MRGTRRGGGRFEGRPSRGTHASRSDVHFQSSRAAALALAVLVAFTAACGPEGGGQPGRDDGPPGSARDRGGGMRGMMDRMMERPSPEAMRGMMAMMDNMPEGVAPAELPEPDSRGARLVARYCSQCHGPPSPSRLSADEWSSTARRMFARMEHMERMGGRMRMTTGDVSAASVEEERVMVDYLRRHALRTVSDDELPAAELPGARLFARACSRCHALPDPSLHPPEDWPAVVQRMRENMRTMDVAELSDEDARRIVEYLRATAAEAEGPGSGAR